LKPCSASSRSSRCRRSSWGDKLTAAEYVPYCDLVIAFYEAVRALPFADAVKLLRNLYATAAAEPDTDRP
jgi:hypothetical protein